MQQQMTISQADRLPLRREVTLPYLFSLVVAGLVTAVSVAGIFYQAAVYPTEDLRISFMPNDVVNLLVGLPILLGSMWATRRGQLLGLLFWPGALFFVVYTYIPYIFAMPLGPLLVPYLALVVLSVYTMAALIAGMDGRVVQRELSGAVPERLAGGVLAGFGVAFSLLATSQLGQTFTGQVHLSITELSVFIADFCVVPAWLVGGVLLWRRRTFGYVVGAGLLFQASMLFVGVIGVLLLQPLLTSAAFAAGDVVALAIMGLIAVVPFLLFVRGIVSR